MACLNLPARGNAAAKHQPTANELTQEEAVTLALQNNAKIKTAISGERVSQALIEFEKSRYYPKVLFREYPGLTDRRFFAFEGAQASGDTFRGNRAISGNRVFNHMEGRLVVPIFDDGFFGRGSHKIAKAKLTWDQSKFVTEATRQETVARVKNLFVNAQKNQLEKDLFQESVSHYQNILNLVKEKFAKNLASQKDVLLAEASLAAAQSDLEAAKHEYEKVLKSLYLMIGLEESKPLRLKPASRKLQPLPAWDQVMHKIPAHNTNLKAKKMDIDIAQEALSLSRTKLYPTVEFQARYFGSVSTESRTYDNSYASYLFMQIPIFEYPLYKDISLKVQEVSLATDKYRESKEDTIRAAMDQYKELQDTGPQLNSLTKKILFLEESYRESLGKYRLDLISFIELANAQLRLHEANKSLVGLYFKYDIGYRKLQIMMGEKA
ncbi:MAG: TolC family protein [Syntrophales bacterium]|nr:TolC family protein [Syntrophales bacterium]